MQVTAYYEHTFYGRAVSQRMLAYGYLRGVRGAVVVRASKAD